MDLHDYYHLRCSEMLALTRDIWQRNSQFVRETADPGLKSVFERHNEPIRVQISNLEQIIDELDGVIGPEEHALAQGLLRSQRQFIGFNPPPAIIDLHRALEGVKLSHLQVANYQGLLAMARQLGEQEFVRLLTHNLESEQRISEDLEAELPALMRILGPPRQRAA